MSNKEDYLKMLPKAQALPLDAIKQPNMPIVISIKEAEDLYHLCIKDKDELVAANLPETVFEELSCLAGALSEAQSVWMADMKDRQDAQQEWKEKAPKAFDLRDQLLHSFRYAYRKHNDVLDRVSAIAEGQSKVDMIQDLNDLSVLGLKHTEQLEMIKFDTSLLVTSAELSEHLSDIRAMANGEKMEGNASLVIRNEMYTLLKRVIDEIRDCGKYVFWKDEKKLAGYTSEYYKMNNN